MNKYLVWLFLAMLSVTNVEYAFGTPSPSFDDDDPAPEQANLYHCNAYGGAARVYTSGRDGAGDNAAFVIEYDNLPQEACIGLATSDWSSSSGSGFIAMAVNADVGGYYRGKCSAKSNVSCAGQGTLGVTNATQACKDGIKNKIAIKFY